jgi:anti-sigma B factor antagonist
VPAKRCSVQWLAPLELDHLGLDRVAVASTPAEIDISNADEVRDCLLGVLGESPALLVVDLSATSFCDSGGVNALVRVYQRALADRAALRFVVTAPVVRRVLAITGVDRLLDIYPTLAAALAGPVPALGEQAGPEATAPEPAAPGTCRPGTGRPVGGP